MFQRFIRSSTARIGEHESEHEEDRGLEQTDQQVCIDVRLGR